MILEDGKYYPMMKVVPYEAERLEKSGREKRKCLDAASWRENIRYLIISGA